MPEFENIPAKQPAPKWPFAALLLACLVLIVVFKAYGVILAILILGFGAFAVYNRPDSRETSTLRASIELSLQDIQDIFNEFERFRFSNDTDSVADRTLYRPALLDSDSSDPAIEEFYYLESTSHRFINRAQAQLAGNLSVSQLDSLLSIADKRSFQLQQAWIEARKAARRLSS